MAFLALCLWREARGESHEGKVAVGYSILNRKAAPQWGNTIMGVLFQRLQYSSLTYASDPQLILWPKDEDPSWQQSMQVAVDVLERRVPNPIDGADSYHDTSIKPPTWATRDKFVKQIGRLMFYRLGT